MFSTRAVDSDVTAIRLQTAAGRVAGLCSNAYLVDGLLVDSGHARARAELLAALEGRSVRKLALTHAHEDHFGNAAAVARRFALQVFAPAGALDDLAHSEGDRMHAYRRWLWGRPETCGASALPPEIESSTGRFRFQVLDTPGHCRAHACFWEPGRRWLFAGDLYLAVKIRLARPMENTRDLLASLRRVLALDPEILFCGHAGPIPRPAPSLRAKIGFLDELRGQASELAAQGLTPPEIARRLLGAEPLSFRWATGGDFSKLNLVRACLKESGEGY